jgi:hypothetical protein
VPRLTQVRRRQLARRVAAVACPSGNEEMLGAPSRTRNGFFVHYEANIAAGRIARRAAFYWVSVCLRGAVFRHRGRAWRTACASVPASSTPQQGASIEVSCHFAATGDDRIKLVGSP